MRTAGIAVILFTTTLALACPPSKADGDIIKFKRGGKQRCVIVEETEESVKFQSLTGMASMPRARIESIEHESDEINAGLKEKWKDKKKKARAAQAETPPEPAKKKESEVQRTYNVEITKRRIMLGGYVSSMASEQPAASFVIKDLGVVNGSRLFHVRVTSHRSGARFISQSSFHCFLRNGLRIDSRPLAGHAGLKARLTMGETAAGHVAFPIDAKLTNMVMKSEVASFDLNLATGQFTTKGSPF